ncbi:MAG: uroporphyrinogen decarboxylase, partial [Gemmatimonadetes bacterium]|nr:uroporphyrinogen decarboxylase [Gemmatimonadota bacterium]
MNDRFLRACRREPVDATPVWFMRQAGRSLPEYRRVRERSSLLEITRDSALCAEVTLQPVHRLGVDAAILFADITLPFSGMGIDFEIRPGVGPVIHDPLRSDAQIERLRRFEPREHVAPLLEAIGLVRRESSVPLIGFAGAPFTLASYLVEGGPS